MSEINILHLKDRIIVNHTIPDEDLKKKINIKIQQLMSKYPQNITYLDVRWNQNIGEGKINIYYQSERNSFFTNLLSSLVNREYQFTINLEFNKMIIILPNEPILKIFKGGYTQQIDEQIQSIFDIPLAKYPLLRRRRRNLPKSK
jgi:hypothetical protein